MNPPRVSVIVPNYNHSRFLRKRIDSVLAQTFQDFDLLLLDDCSTDDSRAILQQYADRPRTRLLLNDTNSGSTFKQWRKGIELTKGQYIWLAESDDFAAPTLLHRLVEQLERNPSVGIAYCESNVIDGDDAVLRTTHDDFTGVGDRSRWRADFVANGRDECATYLSQFNVIENASAAVFRRDVYLAAGGPDESMRLCGDWKLWAQMLLRSDLAHVSEPLNFFRTHLQNVRSNTRQWQIILESIAVYDAIAGGTEIPPEQLEYIRNGLADAGINAWLHRHAIDPQLRAQTLQTLARFDPGYRYRISRRIFSRGLSLIGRGRLSHWGSHVARRVLGRQGKSSLG